MWLVERQPAYRTHMSAQDHNAKSLDRHLQPLVDRWTRCAERANEATTKALGSFPGGSEPRAWLHRWLQDLGAQTDLLLRTPVFLQTMKAHITALLQAEQQTQGELPADALLARRWNKLDAALRCELQKLEQRMQVPPPAPADAGTDQGWDRFLRGIRLARGTARQTLGVTPYDVVHAARSVRLLRYQNSAVRFAEPVLICFSLVNRPYILDLQPERSVVRQLLARGFDVYLLDWGTPTASDRTLRLEDYVCRQLGGAVDVVRKKTGSNPCNLLGYCMGGTMATMFTALRPESVRNLVLMAAPIQFHGNDGLLNLWAQEGQFDVDQLVDTYGNCPGEFLRYCFLLMKPVQNIAEKCLTLCDKWEDEAFLENYFALERWASDSIPVAGETFRDFVKMLYQQDRLIKGEMCLDEAPVRLERIACPLLLLTATRDHLVPPSSTWALQSHVRSSRVKCLSIDTGHIGLAVGSKAHEQLWPEAVAWMADHSTLVAA